MHKPEQRDTGPEAYRALAAAQNEPREEVAARPVYVGTAGWTLPREYAADFPEEGTHLERYARRFRGVEINSSFYKPHRTATYVRWSASVPEGFRFAVKIPKEITHSLKLVDTTLPLERFLAEVDGLGARLGPLLVQLPPSLAFETKVAEAFFACLRARFPGNVVCEPRHAGWFSKEAERVLMDFHISRVAADPAPVPEAAHPGGWRGLIYYRLHGSPRRYYSAYADDVLRTLVQSLNDTLKSASVWCIFDNTALGAATGDALIVTDRFQALQEASVLAEELHKQPGSEYDQKPGKNDPDCDDSYSISLAQR